MKITIPILISGVILSSCDKVKEPATQKKTISVSQNEYEDNSTKDYKAMFGLITGKVILSTAPV